MSGYDQQGSRNNLNSDIATTAPRVREILRAHLIARDLKQNDEEHNKENSQNNNNNNAHNR